MIDNKELIIPLLTFNNDKEGYFVQVLQRKKDHKDSHHKFYLGTNNNNRLIKGYFINSIDRLEKYYPEMIELANVFQARIMINLNKRNLNEVSLIMMEHLAICIRTGNTNVSKLFETVLGQKHTCKEKRWIIDIDKEDLDRIDDIKQAIYICKPLGNKIIAEIPSKTGVHLITSPFDCREFNQSFSLEIQKNNPTNLYIP
jgi:hypothetical protein